MRSNAHNFVVQLGEGAGTALLVETEAIRIDMLNCRLIKLNQYGLLCCTTWQRCINAHFFSCSTVKWCCGNAHEFLCSWVNEKEWRSLCSTAAIGWTNVYVCSTVFWSWSNSYDCVVLSYKGCSSTPDLIALFGEDAAAIMSMTRLHCFF